MNVFAYIRIDDTQSPYMRKKLTETCAEYARGRALGELTAEHVMIEACNILEPLNKRAVGAQLFTRPREGDAVVIPHFSTALAHASSAEAWLRKMSSRGVRVHCVELQKDVTAMLSEFAVVFKTYAHWESRVIRAEQEHAAEAEYNTEILEEFGRAAMAKLSERFVRADFAAAIREAVLDATSLANSRRIGADRVLARDMLNPDYLAKMKNRDPAAYARIMRDV